MMMMYIYKEKQKLNENELDRLDGGREKVEGKGEGRSLAG